MKKRLQKLMMPLALLVFGFATLVTVVPPATVYAATGAQQGQTTAGSTDSPTINCQGGWASPLSWISCPIVDGLTKAISFMDNQINSQMSVGSEGDSTDPNQIFCDSKSVARTVKLDNGTVKNIRPCEAYYNAWSSVRDLALGIMVIIGIIVLMSQALGLEILDAYTIRKVMPRLVIAAVAITLSWQLMQFFVQLSNDLAYGVRYIIYQPFAGLGNPILTGQAQGLFDVFALSALTALGWIGLLSYLGTAALFVFVGFIVLVLRELLITMLIIVAPIAIVAYVLPNTQRYYKLWWESFSKALLMFALISGMIALGRVTAVVAGVGSEDNVKPLAQIVGFVAYFLPYVMILFTFRFAGSALSAISNAVQQRSQGGFNALKGYRSNVAKKNLADLRTGNRLKGEGYGGVMAPYGMFARNFNRLSAGVANVPNAGYNPRRMRARMSAARSNRLIDEAKEAMEKNSDVRALTSDDDLVEASLYAADQIRQGSNRGYESLVREDLERRGYHNVEQGVGLIRRGRNSMNSDSFDSAMAIAQFGTSSGLTPTLQDNPVTGQREIVGGGAQGREMINRVAGNDRQRAIEMLGAARQLAESKGRFDLVGGSFTEDAEMLDELHNGTINQQDLNQRLLRGALDGTGRSRIFGGHRRNLDIMAPEVRELLDESFGVARRTTNDGGQTIGPGGPGQPTEVIQQLAYAANALDAASHNSAESARVVADQVYNQEIDLRTLNPEVLDALGTITYQRDPAGRVIRDPVTNRPVLRTDLGVTTYGNIIEALRSDENFGRYRREYGSAQREAMLGGGGPGGGGGPAGP